MMQTLDWLEEQPDVSKAFAIDSIYLFFEMSSGLISMFQFNELDANGNSRYRGSGSGQLKNMMAGGDCENVVNNKKVLIYAPGYTEFNYGVSAVPARLESSDKIGNVDIKKDELAIYSVINTFADYGLVFIESHGTPYSFMTGHKVVFGEAEVPGDIEQFKEVVLDQVGQDVFDQITSGKLMLCNSVSGFPQDLDWWADQDEYKDGKYSVHATVKYIQDIASLSGTIVVGSFCYSGWVTPIPDGLPYGIGQAFKDKNPISYYGYQRPNGYARIVDSQHCLNMEDSLTRRFLINNDSTGIAHLKADNSQFADAPFRPDLFFVNLGQPNWCYEGCGADLVDTRNGTQVYKTVCIGNQTWMAENLNYSAGGTIGVCYNNSSTNCNVLGRLYGIDELTGAQIYDYQQPSQASIRGICPEGWHVPNSREIDTLFAAIGGEAMANELKADSLWPGSHNDSYGFSMLPSGRWVGWTPGFESLGSEGYLWTCSGLGTDKFNAVRFTTNGVEIFYLAESNPASDPRMKAACRCVKDN